MTHSNQQLAKTPFIHSISMKEWLCQGCICCHMLLFCISATLKMLSQHYSLFSESTISENKYLPKHMQHRINCKTSLRGANGLSYCFLLTKLMAQPYKNTWKLLNFNIYGRKSRQIMKMLNNLLAFPNYQKCIFESN